MKFVSLLDELVLKLNGGKPFSRKMVTGAVTGLIIWAVTLVVAHGFFHPNPTAMSIVPFLAAWAAGIVASWATKEDPALFPK